MSSEVPKRRFRFSLITLIVAVNVAGILIWANHRVQRGHDDGEQYESDRCGWPYTMFIDEADHTSGEPGGDQGPIEFDGRMTRP